MKRYLFVWENTGEGYFQESIFFAIAGSLNEARRVMKETYGVNSPIIHGINETNPKRISLDTDYANGVYGGC